MRKKFLFSLAAGLLAANVAFAAGDGVIPYPENWDTSYDTGDHRQDGYAVNNAWKFFSMWFDHSMLPENQRNQPWIIARPKTVAESQAEKISGILEKSSAAKKTNQIILVIGHNLSLWNKTGDAWKCDFQSYCGYGQKGFKINRREGDMTTPAGSFPILYAFGQEENPGTNMEYRKITENSYFSSVPDKTYNTWVEDPNFSKKSDKLFGVYQFKYGMNIGFNFDPIVPGKGSGIFIHCRTYNRWWSHGCISLPEKMMVELLKKTNPGAYVIMGSDISQIEKVSK